MTTNVTKNSPTGVLDVSQNTSVFRNWHDRSHDNVFGIAAGFVVPTLIEFLQGNSTVKLDMNCALQTQPTLSPVFADVFVNNRVIVCPLRLYVAGLYGNNFLEADVVENIQFPRISYSPEDFDSSMLSSAENLGAILQGSLLAHLRYPRVWSFGAPIETRHWLTKHLLVYLDAGSEITQEIPAYSSPGWSNYNALSILAYYDACLHYVADPYDKSIPFERTDFLVTGEGKVVVNRVRSAVNYDNILNAIYEAKGFNTGTSYLTNGHTSVPIESFVGINLLSTVTFEDTGEVNNFYVDNDLTYNGYLSTVSSHISHNGLFPDTYRPDYFSTYYDDEQVGKLYTINVGDSYVGLRLANAEFNRMATNIIKGQTFKDWNEASYGVELHLSDHPIFVGSDTFKIRFQDIVNTNSGAQKNDSFVPLGTAVARGYAASGLDKTITFTTLEPCIMLVLTSLVPSVHYSADVPAHHEYLKMLDLPNRYYDGVGFENIPFGRMIHTGFNAIEVDEQSIGSVPFYYQHMISYDRVSGLLATNSFRSYVMERDLGVSGYFDELGDPNSIKDIDFLDSIIDLLSSKYINGSNYDYAFASSNPIGDGSVVAETAASENYFMYMHFALRILEPLTNQIISRNTL